MSTHWSNCFTREREKRKLNCSSIRIDTSSINTLQNGKERRTRNKSERLRTRIMSVTHNWNAISRKCLSFQGASKCHKTLLYTMQQHWTSSHPARSTRFCAYLPLLPLLLLSSLPNNTAPLLIKCCKNRQIFQTKLAAIAFPSRRKSEMHAMRETTKHKWKKQKEMAE
jgi:hypothetical protein